jgi:hypothetical protein
MSVALSWLSVEFEIAGAVERVEQQVWDKVSHVGEQVRVS